MLLRKPFPFVRLTAALILGVVLNDFINAQIAWMIGASICLVGLSIWVHLKLKNYNLRWLYGLPINLLFIVFGLLFQSLAIDSYSVSPIPEEKPISWIGEVTHVNHRGERIKSFEVLVKRIDTNELWQETNFKLIVNNKDTGLNLLVGDRVASKSYCKVIKPPRNPRDFNYKQYLNRKQIYHLTYADELQIIEPTFHIKRFASILRKKIYASYKAIGIQASELGVLTALTLGDKSQLEAETANKYAVAGAMHILAVSGLHVGIIYLMFNTLFQSIFSKNKITRWINPLLLLLIIWLFAFIAGLSPSVQRASWMFSFIIIGKILHRNSNVLNAIAVSAFLSIIINPNVIYQLGFQLSYAAVLGIVILHKPIYELLQPKNWLLDKIWSLTVVSLLAQFVTFPFTIFYFHQFPNFFLLTNLFVIPLSFLIVGLTIIACSFYAVLSTHLMLGVILDYLLKALNGGVQLITSLPYSVSDSIWINKWSFILLILMVAAFAIYFLNANKTYFKFGLLCLLAVLVSEIIEASVNNSKQEILVLSYKQPALVVFNNSEVSIYFNFSKGSNAEYRKVVELLTSMNISHHKTIDISNKALIQLKDKLFFFASTASGIRAISPYVDVIIGNSNLFNRLQFYAETKLCIGYGVGKIRVTENIRNFHNLNEQGYLRLIY